MSPFAYQDAKHKNGEWRMENGEWRGGKLMYDKRGKIPNKDVLNHFKVLFQCVVG
jgi:hypothetical protein